MLSQQKMDFQTSFLNIMSLEKKGDLRNRKSAQEGEALKKQLIIIQSPERTCPEKYPCSQGKTSEELLNQIFLIIQEEQQIYRKDSFKSLKLIQKKASSTNFKCKCKKTKCLKMYCQCFAEGKFCNGCSCSQCQNLIQFQDARALAIDQALDRDPQIFRSVVIQKKGRCICRKTECLKKYCECYSSGVPCTSQCKCQNCMNNSNQ